MRASCSTSMKSEALAKFLPAAQPGWTREEAAEDDAAAGGFMGMLGGGTSAAATYRKGAESFTITLVADSPMVSGLGAMISGMAGLAGGKPLRIQRTEFTSKDDALQGVVNDRVMVSVTGDAPASRPRRRISRRWTSRRSGRSRKRSTRRRMHDLPSSPANAGWRGARRRRRRGRGRG